jgi:hypothetical protein
LYFFLVDRKRLVYGARQSEGGVIEREVVESAGVWTVLYKVNDGVSGKSHVDKKMRERVDESGDGIGV